MKVKNVLGFAVTIACCLVRIQKDLLLDAETSLVKTCARSRSESKSNSPQ